MKYVQLGKSGLEVSVITGGAWTIGPYGNMGRLESEQAVNAIQTAFELGVTSFDTAPCYGLGYSEEVVGQAIKDLPRSEIQIMTKCGILWDEAKGALYLKNQNQNGRIVDLYKYAGKQSIIEQCEKSLKRLRTDYIDLYSIHWPDVTTPIEESMEAMNLLLQQGKIRAAGLCNHGAALLDRALKVCNIGCNKVRYSMLYREIEREIVPFCLNNDVGLSCYSVLQRGLLTGEDVPGTAWPANDNSREVALFDPKNVALIKDFLQKIGVVAQDNGMTVSQLAIHWLLDQPGISVALLTARDRDQLEHDIAVLDISLGEADKNTVDAYLTELEGELEFEDLRPEIKKIIAQVCTQ